MVSRPSSISSAMTSATLGAMPTPILNPPLATNCRGASGKGPSIGARLRLRGRSVTRPAFLYDDRRLIMPAFGTYTGGLYSDAPVLQALMGPQACAILTGPQPTAIPMPR